MRINSVYRIARNLSCVRFVSAPLVALQPQVHSMAADNRDKHIRAEDVHIEGIDTSHDIIQKGMCQPEEAKKAKKKKLLPPPAHILPGHLPDSMTVWENAVILIDKPKGWTSFDVCGRIRGQVAALLGKRNKEIKVGHAGTLDPMATGLLIVCVGRATKGIDAFVAMKKEYSGLLRLGEGTPSFDAETEVTEKLPWEHITDENLLECRQKFVGEIEQLPPMFSAIRVGGKRLYEAAREGKEIERAARRVTVDQFDLERAESSGQDITFYVTCSKGTYIRSLAHDLGVTLGSAAHLTALRREAIGEHRVENAWSIEDLSCKLTDMKQKIRGTCEALPQSATNEKEMKPPV